MEKTTLEVIAPSVEEATERGLTQLGLPREQVQIEVLDEGSRGFLGIGGRQVRIRLTVNPPSEAAAPLETAAQPLPAAKNPPSEADSALLAQAVEVTQNLLAQMKIEAQVSASFLPSEHSGEQNLHIDIHGEELSILIGRHAETLNALQYILGLILGKQAETWVQVTVDVEGYRARREKQLRQLAHRMAEQALRSGKRQVLEPMPAAERRIVHLELREVEGVTSESLGEEPNRKVTIVPR